jgi:glycosyltransferase involved in cell wall biosynthesis
VHKPLTILQIVPSLQSGGVERGTIEIAKALMQTGHRALVASEGGPMVHELAQIGATHIHLPLASKNPFIWWKNGKALKKLVQEEHIDLIHARSRAPAWSAAFGAPFSHSTTNDLLEPISINTPWITTFHGIYGLKPAIKRYYNAIMTKGAYTIAISNYVRQHIMTHYHLDPTKLVLIPRGADTDYFNPANLTNDRIVAIQNHLYGTNRPDLLESSQSIKPVMRWLCPARITRWKGQDIAIKAIAHLKKHHPNIEHILIIAGDAKHHDHYRKELMELIEQEELTQSVWIVPHLHDMPAAYSQVDGVLVPSSAQEAFGRVVCEAQAMEKIVLASAVGGMVETIIPGITGFHIHDMQIQSWAQTMMESAHLLPLQRVELGKAARKHVTEHFSIAKMTASTLALYEKVATKQSAFIPNSSHS